MTGAVDARFAMWNTVSSHLSYQTEAGHSHPVPTLERRGVRMLGVVCSLHTRAYAKSTKSIDYSEYSVHCLDLLLRQTIIDPNTRARLA